MNNRNVYIIGGPNGSGKTTFAIKFLPEYARCRNFVNADLIAEGKNGKVKVINESSYNSIVQGIGGL